MNSRARQPIVDTIRAPRPSYLARPDAFAPEEPSSGIHRVVPQVTEAGYEAIFNKIAGEWLAPANDSGPSDGESLREIFGSLGSLERIPYIAMREEAQWRAEADHVEAFILDLVDGILTLNAIVDASPLPILEVLRMLAELKTKGVIALR